MTDRLPAIPGYEIFGILGEGAMGAVYHALHVASRRHVALKTVKAVSATLLPSLRREIHVLTTLRHPGIVRIEDHGTAGGLPWYAMELVVGQPLGAYCLGYWHPPVARLDDDDTGEKTTPGGDTDRTTAHADVGRTVDHRDREHAPPPLHLPPPCLPPRAAGGAVGGGREAGSGRAGRAAAPPEPRTNLPEVLRVVHRLALTLSYLHGEGVLHRDIKPQNVLVRADGEPVLTDFGLAHQWVNQSSRERLAEEYARSGTLLYMSPEQIRGDLLDARSDLYALGCVLFQLLTGQPPFVTLVTRALVDMHLRATPQPPSALVRGIPPKLDELVIGLLEKDRRRRVSHADVVCAVVEGLGETATYAGPLPACRPVLYRPGMVGREPALRVAAELVRGLSRRRAALCLVRGASGVGKTRFASEFGRLAVTQRVLVLPGAFAAPRADGSPDPDGAHPLGGFRHVFQYVADRCQEWGVEAASMLLGKDAPVLAPYYPRLLALPGVAGTEPPEELAPEAMRLRAFEALAKLLAKTSEGEAMAIVIDDLQWGDELTVAFLEHVLASGRLWRMEIGLVATYRTDEAGAWQDRLARLAQQSGVVAVDLGRLDVTAVESMVADMLGVHHRVADLAVVLERSCEGNPFFVAEYLRTAVLEGALGRDHLGRWVVQVGTARACGAGDAGDFEDAVDLEGFSRLPTPAGVAELLRSRLAGVREDAMALLRAAAVIGREVAVGLLQSIVGLSADAFDEALGALLRRHLLEELPLLQRLRFLHEKLREAAYAGLSPESARELHRAVAVNLERQGGDDVAVDFAPALARHWEAAGEIAKAIDAYVRAADRDRAAASLETAIGYLDRALALVPSQCTGERLALLERRARLFDLHGEHAQSIADIEAARAIVAAAPRPDVRLKELLLLEAATRIRSRAAEAALAPAAQAQALALAQGDTEGACNALTYLGVSRWQLGDTDQARDDLRRARSLLTAGAAPELAVRLLGYSGLVEEAGGHFDSALGYLEKSLELARASGHTRGVVSTLQNLGILCLRQGDAARSRGYFEEAMARCEEIGDRLQAGTIALNRGAALLDTGPLAEAEEAFLRALDVFASIGSRAMQTQAENNLGIVKRQLGLGQEAVELLTNVVASHRARDDAVGLGLALYNLGAALVDVGRFGEAREVLAESLRLCSTRGDPYHEAEVRERLAFAAYLSGDVEEAVRGYDAGLAVAAGLGLELLQRCMNAWRAVAAGGGMWPLAAAAAPPAGAAVGAEAAEMDLELSVEALLGEATLCIERGTEAGDFEQGLARAAEAIGRLSRLGARSRLAVALVLKARGLERLGRPDEADAAGAAAAAVLGRALHGMDMAFRRDAAAHPQLAPILRWRARRQATAGADQHKE
ncbi:MAG: protein kinase [Candidatus Schekmanbacteria bacterium]|nr:protein kinase [Candidatus Schekmanbacteria bacterium]